MKIIRINNDFYDMERFIWAFVDYDTSEGIVELELHLEEEVIGLEGEEAKQMINWLHKNSENG